MESIDSNAIKVIIITVLRGPFVVAVGVFFKEGILSFVFLSVCESNSSNPKPAELATFGWVSWLAVVVGRGRTDGS